MFNRLLILGIIFLCLPVLSLAEETQAEKEIIQVTGLVRLVGNHLNMEIIISTSDRINWYIPGNEREKLHNLQHRTVTVEGEKFAVEMTLASGRLTNTRLYLRNIRIISVLEE